MFTELNALIIYFYIFEFFSLTMNKIILFYIKYIKLNTNSDELRSFSLKIE